MTKNATYWIPGSGFGYVLPQTGLFLQDNLGNVIINNLGSSLIPNAYYVIGKYATSWSQL